ncbi:(2Fe-2S)-binding protein [Novosphingobium marinum]|uniref:Phenylpropionate dioxygenase-like ring-hydroxylating dioxygenase large terminal subunit n=1 Tax=Novosphingobium marinum TaxID=1514948 RepID=A0A7Y9XT65_9SPHN|nr:aromatic ring-hydroxylating dioxygenase subunit alpha [Novosphingobium marinum]NYH94037.1 phenylpropionate dioxygenase-like ring-hydroxylating dioxygenase large terminal subunit [Novosphingobium marinum]GGC19124.1 (2Fe-2S)-binding protein [Novosphingobium marinum]
MATKSKPRYAAIRFNDRPIKNVLADPESFVLEPGENTADYEEKPDRRLDELYPDIADYRVVSTDRFIGEADKAIEEQRLWSRTWLLAGFSSDLKEKGDWFKFDIGPQSLIVVRSSPGDVSAFYNVCKHRGNELVQDDFGSGFDCFTCIVHSWRYSLKGKNVRVTDRESFSREALGENLDLTPVSVREWNGMVFVNLSEDPMPFEEYYGDLLPMLASYRIDEMFVIKELTVEIPANWKTMYSVFNETYHAHATHPQAKLMFDDHFVQYDFYPNGHNRNLFALGVVSERWPDQRFINAALAFMMDEVGLKASRFKGDATQVRRAMQKAKRENEPFGMSYEGFTDNQLTDDWNPSLFPNVTLNMHPEGILVMRFRPHPTDPEKGFWDNIVLARKLADGRRPPAYMGADPDADVTGETRPAREHADVADPPSSELLIQDLDNMVTFHRGLKSKGLKGKIVFSEQERRIQQFLAELDLYLNNEK